MSDLPEVTSPYEGRRLKVREHLAISSYWFATNFLWGALLAIMLPAEIRTLAPELRVQALGLLTGCAAIVALMTPLIAGALSDRCASRWGRRRPFIAAGLVVNLLGLALMAVTFVQAEPVATTGAEGVRGFGDAVRTLLGNSGIVAFFVAYLVVQLGNNIASAAYSGVIPDLVPPDQRGAASGFMAAMTQLGTLFGAVLTGQLIAFDAERVRGLTAEAARQALVDAEMRRYLLVGAVMLGVTLITLFGIRETPLPTKPPPIRWREYLKSLWISPREHPDFAWVWLTRALVMLGFYAVLPFVNYYLGDVIRVENPEATAAQLIGVLLIASTISGVFGGFVSDRIGRKRVVFLANSAIAVMAVAFIFCRTLPQVLVCGLIFGLGFGAYTSVDWALGTDVLPSRSHAAKEMAVWHIAMTLPQSIASPAAGFLVASFGLRQEVVDGVNVTHYTIAGYSSVFLLCAICFALGAVLLRNVKGVR